MLMKKAHQQDFGKNVCIYSCKKKSKYSAAKRKLCLKKKKKNPQDSGVTTQTLWTEGRTCDSEGKEEWRNPSSPLTRKCQVRHARILPLWSLISAVGGKWSRGLWGERAAASGRAQRGTKCKHVYTAPWSLGLKGCRSAVKRGGDIRLLDFHRFCLNLCIINGFITEKFTFRLSN